MAQEGIVQVGCTRCGVSAVERRRSRSYRVRRMRWEVGHRECAWVMGIGVGVGVGVGLGLKEGEG